ncbi:hypothetical protein [Alkalicoccus chagannorensis]|uniref:hypothetical protein n=1 Tax=Alkalicoccus chagannorensis TaxID=427072 RepID=UPI0006884243|nr:hypothetical protein [Alkalicoccus chagannorensis]
MNDVFKMNVVSLLCAVMAWIPLELMLNVYRISRWTPWEIETVTMWMIAATAVVVAGGTTGLYLLSKRWLHGRKANAWITILWIPYLVLFVYVVASLFPITYRGDMPNPVTGLLAMGGGVIYPIYIFFVQLAADAYRSEGNIQE